MSKPSQSEKMDLKEKAHQAVRYDIVELMEEEHGETNPINDESMVMEVIDKEKTVVRLLENHLDACIVNYRLNKDYSSFILMKQAFQRLYRM